MCEHRNEKIWSYVGGAVGSKSLQFIFNVECTVTMMSLSKDVLKGQLGGAVVIYICMIGQIFKALLGLVFSFLGNDTNFSELSC
jgi:hypothetical protein